jgi:hypothetical protein
MIRYRLCILQQAQETVDLVLQSNVIVAQFLIAVTQISIIRHRMGIDLRKMLEDVADLICKLSEGGIIKTRPALIFFWLHLVMDRDAVPDTRL